MKRILISILLLTLIICLPACTNGNDNPKIEENPDFATYKALFEKEFVNYTIDISITNTNNDVITEKYDVTLENGVRSVAYRIERLNQFIINGDEIVVPDSYISVEEGVYDATTSGLEKYNVPKFNFSYTCLTDDETALPGLYYTNISSLQVFMGINASSDDATVELSYDGDKVEFITVTYVTEDDNTVVITYTFN